MTSLKNEYQSQNTELYEEISALDIELTENFKPQLSIAPFLSRKTDGYVWPYTTS